MNRFTQELSDHIARATKRDHARIDVSADVVANTIDNWFAEVARLTTQVPNLLQKLNEIAQYHSRQLYRRYLLHLETTGVTSYTEKADIIRRTLPDKAKQWLIGHAVETLKQVATPQPQRWVPVMKLAIPDVDLTKLSELSETAKDKLMKSVVFPSPSRADMARLLTHQQALGKIAPITSQVSPQTLIAVFTRAESQGMSRADIINKELRPLFHGVKSDAKRVGRTMGALIANEGNMQAFQGLGSLLIGYQCHCVTDKASRPWHQARKGVIYWIKPKPGQKGLRQMPRPPYEPEDSNERPAGTPECAYNCRCFFSPVTKNLLDLVA